MGCLLFFCSVLCCTLNLSGVLVLQASERQPVLQATGFRRLNGAPAVSSHDISANVHTGNIEINERKAKHCTFLILTCISR